MIFKEYTYSVLLVSSSQKFSEQILKMLPDNEFGPKICAKSSGEAKRLLLDRSFDIVLINTPLSDDFGSKLAEDVALNSRSGVLMFVKNDLYESVTDSAADSGVFTLSKPIAHSTLTQVINILYALCERLSLHNKKTVSLQDKMEEIRVINRAKWVLIKHVNMTEDEAHRLIEKQAMDTRTTRRAVAESIIRTYES